MTHSKTPMYEPLPSPPPRLILTPVQFKLTGEPQNPEVTVNDSPTILIDSECAVQTLIKETADESNESVVTKKMSCAHAIPRTNGPEKLTDGPDNIWPEDWNREGYDELKQNGVEDESATRTVPMPQL